jgi:hypothetical protein
MAQLKEIKPEERFFTLELTGKELELLLDGLYNVKERYTFLAISESAEYFNLAQGMIEHFGEVYYGAEGEWPVVPPK